MLQAVEHWQCDDQLHWLYHSMRVASATLLVYCELNRPSALVTNVSNVAVAAVLEQRQGIRWLSFTYFRDSTYLKELGLLSKRITNRWFMLCVLSKVVQISWFDILVIFHNSVRYIPFNIRTSRPWQHAKAGFQRFSSAYSGACSNFRAISRRLLWPRLHSDVRLWLRWCLQ